MPSWFISLAVGAVIPALSACCATAWAWGLARDPEFGDQMIDAGRDREISAAYRETG